MRKGIPRIILGLVLALAFAQNASADDDLKSYTIMHPDRETRLSWIEAYKIAPRAHIDEELRLSIPFRGSLSLLSHLNYTPSARNQGQCGNCWAWAGTGAMGIALDVEKSIFDRLSVQFISSCNTAKDCCAGGWLEDLASFYSSEGYTVPWSNTNASWQNGDGNCNVVCETISTSPKYNITSIEEETIDTQDVGQAQAIANIKNILNQNKAVWFAFYMSTAEDWTDFFSFWGNQTESVLWNFDDTCGKAYDPVDGGAHAVLCVGYNDDDPDNSYWIMLNSYGTETGRPNGLFRVDMDMNYDCYYFYGGNATYSLYWQTLDVSFSTEVQNSYVDPSGSCNGNTPCYTTIQAAVNAASTGTTIKILQGSYSENVSLSTSKELTLSGGWNSSYTSQASISYASSLTRSKGTFIVKRVGIQR
ncbi:MAG: hypothetical protein H8D55_02475 [Deltaproteobacteria bacterium]|nr:hypothetical protein [Deltaproteobacteria bacterium]MBL7217175.1 hypothetical protein [Desulfobacteraceae bacterium]